MKAVRTRARRNLPERETANGKRGESIGSGGLGKMSCQGQKAEEEEKERKGPRRSPTE